MTEKKKWIHYSIKLTAGILIGVLAGILAHDTRIGLLGAALCSVSLFIRLPKILREGKYSFAVLLAGSPLYYFCITEVLNYHYPWNTFLIPLLFNLLFYLSFILIIYVICGRLMMGLYGASVFSCLLAVVNYFVRTYKDAPFTVYDVFSVRTLFNVLGGGMELRTDWVISAGLIGYALYWILLFQFRKAPGLQKGKSLPRLMAVAFLLMLYIAVFGAGILKTLGVDTTIYHAAEKNGFIVQFIEGYRSSRLTAPEGYSKESVKAICSKYEKETSIKERPNIIVIMNESFADLRYYGEVETDIDVMPYIDSLTENTVKGWALSSVFGGNTANSEWEFLTGNTMAFMPAGSVPFQMYLNTDSQSLTRLLHEYGYQSAAFHPYESTGWLRKQAWLHLGFDECYFIEDFDVSEEENIVNQKLKDLANYERILEYIDTQDAEQPLFIFNVTIQNHTGGYHEAEAELGYKVHLLGEAADKYNYVEGYLTMMHESDQALGYLIEELKTRDEKWVVMMFGDHQVDFGEGNKYLEMISGKTMAQRTEEEREDLYTVPYLIWANYDINTVSADQTERTSINYLSAKLLETIDMPGTGYHAFLSELSKEYPAINAKGVFDREGVFIPYSKLTTLDSEMLGEYRILQYNNMFGGSEYEREFFEK